MLSNWAQEVFLYTSKISRKKLKQVEDKFSNMGGKYLEFRLVMPLILIPWVLVRKRTIPIERSPPVSEASANFSG
jgi:hypothetical protein